MDFSQQDAVGSHLRIKWKLAALAPRAGPSMDGPQNCLDSHPPPLVLKGFLLLNFSKYRICFSLKRLILSPLRHIYIWIELYSAVEFELLKQKLCSVYEHFVICYKILIK